MTGLPKEESKENGEFGAVRILVTVAKREALGRKTERVNGVPGLGTTARSTWQASSRRALALAVTF